MVQICERTISEMSGLLAVYIVTCVFGGDVFIEEKDRRGYMLELSNGDIYCVERAVSDIIYCDENPIESLMAGFLFNIAWIFGPEISVFYESKYYQLGFTGQKTARKDETIIKISQQVKEGNYRVDFVINVINKTKGIDKKIGIECDGYAYHEKSQEQMIYEKKRQRYLTEKGYVMLHFMGKEIMDGVKKQAGFVFFGADIFQEISTQVKKILNECQNKKETL